MTGIRIRLTASEVEIVADALNFFRCANIDIAEPLPGTEQPYTEADVADLERRIEKAAAA